jgi:hypothetical protein
MKTVFSNRIAVVAIVLLGAVVLFLFARTFLLNSNSDEAAIPSASAPTGSKPSADTPAVPSDTSPARPAQPKIKLLPGLPAQVDQALRSSRVVVVSLYAGSSASDRLAVGRARAAAGSVGAGFVAINAFNEKNARELQPFAGAMSLPSVLVVRRPGTVVKRFEGFVDPTVTAQAARNAGARIR